MYDIRDPTTTIRRADTDESFLSVRLPRLITGTKFSEIRVRPRERGTRAYGRLEYVGPTCLDHCRSSLGLARIPSRQPIPPMLAFQKWAQPHLRGHDCDHKCDECFVYAAASFRGAEPAPFPNPSRRKFTSSWFTSSACVQVMQWGPSFTTNSRARLITLAVRSPEALIGRIRSASP